MSHLPFSISTTNAVSRSFLLVVIVIMIKNININDVSIVVSSIVMIAPVLSLHIIGMLTFVLLGGGIICNIASRDDDEEDCDADDRGHGPRWRAVLVDKDHDDATATTDDGSHPHDAMSHAKTTHLEQSTGVGQAVGLSPMPRS